MLLRFHSKLPFRLREVIHNIDQDVIDLHLQVQVVARGIAGGTDIAQNLSLGNILPHADDRGAIHVSVQRRVGVAVVVLAMVDLDIVAPAVMVGRGGDNAAGNGVNFGAARCGIVGAAVAVAAEIAGNVLIGSQRATEIQRALDGRIP